MTVFTGKNVVVGVCGSIAAFKVAGWVSSLAKMEAMVDVAMTPAAERFVTPLTFASLSGRKVYSAMFDGAVDGSMAHIDLGREADLFVVAPATADTIARLAHGMADTLVTAVALVARCPKLLFPAMNVQMFASPPVQENLKKLREFGWTVVAPASGSMACGEVGKGRLVEWEEAQEYLAVALSRQDLAGMRVVVTAGPTREPVDPARFLSNRSSGRMGYALASAAARRGAAVILISGPSSLPAPPLVTLKRVETAREMHDAVMAESEQARVVIKAAAVSDYRPEKVAPHKVKKENIEMEMRLAQNPDILFALGEKKPKGQILVGFAAESQNLEAEGRRKLTKKNLDLICVNDISASDAGFESETNRILLLDRDGGEERLPLISKLETADRILDRVVALSCAP